MNTGSNFLPRHWSPFSKRAGSGTQGTGSCRVNVVIEAHLITAISTSEIIERFLGIDFDIIILKKLY